MSVQRSALAESDLYEIWAFVAKENVDAADRLLDLLDDKCRLIETQPLIGRHRLDLGVEVRNHAVGDSVIFNRPVPSGIEVLRVLHGARNVPNLFQLPD